MKIIAIIVTDEATAQSCRDIVISGIKEVRLKSIEDLSDDDEILDHFRAT